MTNPAETWRRAILESTPSKGGDPHSFEIQKTGVIKIEDACGRPIRVGSVLMNERGVRGWVTEIALPGGGAVIRPAPMFAEVGEITIKTGPGTYRITNCYSEWVHIPRNLQTYEERLQAWLLTDYEHDDSRDASRDEGMAIDGILAILPVDPVDWESESAAWPERLEDALFHLVHHLDDLRAGRYQDGS